MIVLICLTLILCIVLLKTGLTQHAQRGRGRTRYVQDNGCCHRGDKTFSLWCYALDVKIGARKMSVKDLNLVQVKFRPHTIGVLPEQDIGTSREKKEGRLKVIKGVSKSIHFTLSLCPIQTSDLVGRRRNVR